MTQKGFKPLYRVIPVYAAIFSLSAVSAHFDFEKEFVSPPDSARPGVYWYFMDGNLTREGMTADLESMKDAGLGNLVFLEVNVGVPRGPVKFMSDPWQELFAHAVYEAQRLGIDITLGVGPGWTGSGGPWVKPEQSMQHLVFSSIDVKGPAKLDTVLEVPGQRSTPWHNLSNPYYKDFAVYAFPRCKPGVADINEKALFERDPYTSKPGVKPFLPAPAYYQQLETKDVISIQGMMDLTEHMDADGRLQWDVPQGEWTILRMAARTTGAVTRPAPEPGIGLECDKFDPAAFDAHFENFIGKLLNKVGPRSKDHGWTTLHMDSWEMGAQNWTDNFCKEFQDRRGYDPAPYLPAYSGRVVESLEMTERFLWDVRLTCQELVLDYHAEHIKELGRKHGFELSIEPYDMTPAADLDLGAVADVPMGEFWSAGMGFDSSFSCIEAASIAHTMGRQIVSSEAFTANPGEGWRQYPGSMKNQGDWAFCMGINRFVYHTFAHQPLGEGVLPGMTMGPYGVHWDRNQTWWPMASDYHRYVSRCSHLLRQGVSVADILYLTPEGAPHVFLPPESAMEGSGPLRDKKGYSFDGISPNILMARAAVEDGKIVFPGGTSYRMLVLPAFETMTPKLLTKIKELLNAGAVVVGTPPVKSPGLSDYPLCDQQVQTLATEIWASLKAPTDITARRVGKGHLFWGGEISRPSARLYPAYDLTAALLKEQGLPEDFTAAGPVRFIHRRTDQLDIYFVSNRSGQKIDVTGTFRVQGGRPELWHPVEGQRRSLKDFTVHQGTVSVPLQFEAYESYFMVFFRNEKADTVDAPGTPNFPVKTVVATIDGPWEVSFDPALGAPAAISFDTLNDWTSHRDQGIKYYSGIATYRKTIDLPEDLTVVQSLYLDLGTVHNIARVRWNGKDLGVVWTAPWHVRVEGALKTKGNVVEIDVANTWGNRLIGDQQPENKDTRQVKWDNGLLEAKTYPAGRYTFTTSNPYRADTPLMPAGLVGPVTLQSIKYLQN